MSNNPFVLEIDQYQRDLDVMGNYIHQASVYLSKMNDVPVERAREFVETNLRPGGLFEFKDPVLFHTTKNPHGDRVKTQSGFLEYIGKSVRDRDIIAPTLTTYLHPEVKESPLVKSIDRNVKLRADNKKMMFAAKMSGNKELETFKNEEQTGNKLSNNALSGAHVSASTPLYNLSAHTTLTSTCRITSGYGNANNEKFLSGNRHYYSEAIIRNNITSVIANTDYDQLKETIEEFGLVYPTPEYVLSQIVRCWNHYERDTAGQERIYTYLERLSPLELAAFMYTGDLYQIKELNPDFMRSFVEQLISPIPVELSDEEVVSFMKKANGDYRVFGSQIHNSKTKGVPLHKTEDFFRDHKDRPVNEAPHWDVYKLVAGTTKNIYDVVGKYRKFIKTFFLTTNLPASVAYFPSAVRYAVVMSDTDSTIFTVQDWVHWYCGYYSFDDIGTAVSEAFIFLASQAITHTLAVMSANIGVERKRLFQIEMKNEYKFDVFVPTQVAKHYYAAITRKEAAIYKDIDLERKGVQLRSSKVPAQIMADAGDTMRQICRDIMSGKNLVLLDQITAVADKEREIHRSIKNGHVDYFTFSRINMAEGYSNPDPIKTPYSHYDMWRKVFEPTYGPIEPPPYVAVKVNTTLKSKSSLNEWLDGMQNRQIAQAMQDWLTRNNKNVPTTFNLSLEYIRTHGIPQEIFDIINSRKIILDNTSVFYLILETLGFYMKESGSSDKVKRLLMDFY